MPKRKDIVDSDQDEAAETPEEFEEGKPKKKSKAKVTAKKPLYEDSESEEVERPIKKKKSGKSSTPKSPESGPTSVQTNSDGEKYLDLGRKKRVTVRSFKGAALIDIREFYGQEGDEKPGKKGIALSPDQWEALKNNAETIDYLLKRLKK
ncbi:hypothetical protein PHLGIDRAFT_23523 [Phlebiopsis gigantea 11061_1 CR5-6]|uniref:Transcriptional coactivator p15 (PC4) C-terminal domain-containing protein n=1 Tax=Phlebiopsis gigantea (strain 11061_1 CR5-6) TaxID=745531 RepID=A0A0C3SBZ2_PHLG1|nr:hypothetical protein PHLGIDRAFT_23523 [Phlebiopsis gigantea 11061_1 CR5-6]